MKGRLIDMLEDDDDLYDMEELDDEDEGHPWFTLFWIVAVMVLAVWVVVNC